MGNRGHGGGPSSKWDDAAWRGDYPACPYCIAGYRETCVTTSLRKRKPHKERERLIEELEAKTKRQSKTPPPPPPVYPVPKFGGPPKEWLPADDDIEIS